MTGERSQATWNQRGGELKTGAVPASSIYVYYFRPRDKWAVLWYIYAPEPNRRFAPVSTSAVREKLLLPKEMVPRAIVLVDAVAAPDLRTGIDADLKTQSSLFCYLCVATLLLAATCSNSRGAPVLWRVLRKSPFQLLSSRTPVLLRNKSGRLNKTNEEPKVAPLYFTSRSLRTPGWQSFGGILG